MGILPHRAEMEEPQIMKMDREDARREVRARWREIITEYTSPARDRVNGETSYICPLCGHGTHGDGLTRNPKGKPGNLKCFGCSWSGDIIDLIQAATGADHSTALNEAAQLIGIEIKPYRTDAREDFSQQAQEPARFDHREGFSPKGKETPTGGTKSPEKGKTSPEEGQTPDYRGYYAECAARISDPAAADYITGRGISLDTARAYNIGFDPIADPAGSGHRAPRIIIPVTPGHYIGRSIDPATDKKYRKMNNSGAKIGIFNAQALAPVEGEAAAPVFVTEGAFDALAVLETGAQALALNSASNTGLLLETIDAAKAPGPFILCLDHDEAGQRAQKELTEALQARGLPVIEADISGSHKDPNEALTGDRAKFEEAIAAAEAAGIAERDRDDLTRFFEKIQTEAYKPHQTGLAFFDDLLAGGIVRQMVVLIMAAPGAGKTTLCQQIAEEMARRKKPVIFLNLEMSKEQMLAKAISAKIAQEGKGSMTAADVLQGYRWTPEQRQIVTETIERYRREIFPYMKYNPDGITGDLEQLIEYLDEKGQEAKARGEEAPAVVLDYLHLVSTSKGLDLQELIKQAVNETKQYCIKYNTFAIIVSATNRISNTTGRITLESGRDSSNIEYGGDAQISLNYWEVDQGKVKPSNPDEMAGLMTQPNRRMILRVLKSRFSPPARFARVWFNGATNRFFGEYEFIPADISGELVPFDAQERKTLEELAPAADQTPGRINRI